ncbi:MAG: glycosyltransferase [Nitrospinae bacterium]|nr:glycosyltransferase [Nitrospinota bacterium]
MSRLLFLARSLETGGAERQLTVTAQALKRMGHEVHVAVFYSGGAFEKDMAEAGIPVVRLNKKGRWDTAGFAARLVKTVRSIKPSAVLSYLGPPNIMAASLKPFFGGAKVIWSVRASFMDLSRYDWLTGFSYTLERGLVTFADRVIVNSKAGMAILADKGYPAARLSVVPNGIDTQMFRPDREAGAKVRAELGYSQNDKVVGLAARLDPMKDHPTFLHAAKIMLNARPGLRFLIVGGGPEEYFEKMRKLAAELGLGAAVTFTGERSDMPALYNAMDIAALSSIGEGFPNAVGEAMACGVPCVATDVGDAAWIAGETGIIVPPKNPEALSKGIMEMLARMESNRDAVSGKARERIAKMFGVEAMAAQTLRVIEEAR